jgi:hypothetical protein
MNEPKSQTPLTDTAQQEYDHNTCGVSRDFARQLERELVEAKATNAELVKDKERLNWLELHRADFMGNPLFKAEDVALSMRSAIDAAKGM